MKIILWDLNGSTVQVFSHLDFKFAYHLVVLAPESRTVILFQTHTGVFQYASLVEQIVHLNCIKVVKWVFQNCQGILSFFDDTVVHGKDEVNNANLLAVLVCSSM